jgi:hypothetical protein
MLSCVASMRRSLRDDDAFTMAESWLPIAATRRSHGRKALTCPEMANTAVASGSVRAAVGRRCQMERPKIMMNAMTIPMTAKPATASHDRPRTARNPARAAWIVK